MHFAVLSGNRSFGQPNGDEAPTNTQAVLAASVPTQPGSHEGHG